MIAVRRLLETRYRALSLLASVDLRGKREGHQPGEQDVSSLEGLPFQARPNFYYFGGVDRPAWLPLYARPKIEKGQHVTDKWPYEPHDFVTVIDQATGDRILGSGLIRNEHVILPWLTLEQSNLWDKVLVPQSRVRPGWRNRLESTRDGKFHYAYGPDIWLGNTGRRT